uniref:Amyloid beta A4 protein-binding family B member 2 n=1 Tax=Timema tahoe TaxID=61484 RepID=A0A7R9NXY8_9NEOP|nr:unnamed protein product [Timema tahoe]
MQPAGHNLPRPALKLQINQSEYSQLELNPAPLSDKVGNVNAVDEVPHVAGQLNNDLYAVPVKRRSQPPVVVADLTAQSPDTDTESGLPSGWEKHEDNDGPYYWHIKSGTIQREPPAMPAPGKTESRRLLVKEAESVSTLVSGLFAALVVGTSLGKHRSTMVYFNIPDDGFRALTNYQSGVIGSVTRSSTSSALEELDGKKKEDRKEELALKRRSYPARAEPESKERPIRFAVRSLGWVEIAEEDLTPERSSRAVNKCIVDLSLGRNDLLDVVGRWGDGKDLFMDLDEGALKLIDPENLTVLNTQPIHTIRVDFAYVARDRTTRKHMCHVFRCDIPARTIANTLRDICKKIMIERSLQQNLAKPIDISGSGINGRSGLATRPTNLPTEHRRMHHRNGQALVTQSFPTPMEEPKKVLRAQYLGSTQVGQATGMDVLNDAIDHMASLLPQDKWRHVNVAVAPSMISILHPGYQTVRAERGGGAVHLSRQRVRGRCGPAPVESVTDENKLLAECRVRYLSFLGIGRNVKHCGFIMHTAQDLFIAHVFYCEPSSGALCKTIEAACKLRYQKCLDAHPQGVGRNQSNAQTPGRGLGATLKSLVGTLTGQYSFLEEVSTVESWRRPCLKVYTCNGNIVHVCAFVKELWPLPAEREVIKHKHLQSPLTFKYFSTSPPSASLRSLLSPTLDTRRLNLARWDTHP